MNKSYRCIWNEALNAWVAVSELVTRSGKSQSVKDNTQSMQSAGAIFTRKPLVAALAQLSLLAVAPFASAQVVIPTGTDIGGYLNSGTNWSASAYQFAINSNATWNSAVSMNSAAKSTLSLDGNGNAITRGGNQVFNLTSAVDGNSITLSNLTLGQTANSAYGVFYDNGGTHTSNIYLNNVTFDGLQGAYGNVFYMSGTTGSTFMNVTAGTGANGAVFSNNVSTGDGGGVISLYGGNMTFNGDYTFDSNTTDNYGGAIAMYQNTGVLTFNGNTVFNNNSARNYFGGAIDIWGGASTLTFNGDTTFTGNHVVTSSTGAGNPRGGAINIGYLSPGSGASVVEFNAPVVFDGNYVVSTGAGGSAYGGAISAYGNGSSYNYQYLFNAAAIFRNNYAIKAGSGSGAGNGGAIYYDSSAALVSLSSGSQFLDNYASTNGGAIYLQSGTVALNALNDNIVFQGNKQGVQFDSSYAPIAGTGTPNAIYLGSSGTLNLNANAGYQILFYDPVGSIAGSTVTVNKTGAGEVVFYGDNGATTNYDSAIQANTSVQGGTFVLADGVNYGSTSGGTFTITTGTDTDGSATAGTLVGNDNTSVRAQTLNLQTGGTIDVAGGLFTLDAANINVQDGGQIAGSGTLASTGNITLGGNAIMNVDAGKTLNVTGLLAGSGGLTAQGGGMLELSNGGNSYTGATTISAGSTLLGGVANAFAASSAVEVDGTLDLSQNNLDQTANGLSGTGSVLLGSADLTSGGTAATTFSGVISGTGALTKSDAGTLTLSGANTYSGGTTIDGGTLVATNGNALGSGAVANNGTLQLDFADNGTLANQLTGTGALLKTGGGAATLSAANSSAGAVNVTAGTLAFDQNGVFSADSLTTASGATTTLGFNSQLEIANALTQSADSVLNVNVGGQNAPLISADSATLGGTLNVAGFSSSAPASVSAAEDSTYAIISTTNGITGDFSSVSVGGATAPVDYLTVEARKSADNLSYGVGFGLTWDAGTTNGNGTFTLTDASEAFNADVVLADQAASATGWNGKDLTKNGAGTLTLSAQNTYTGATTINGGTLATGTENAFADSSSVTVNEGATLALNGFSQTANNLSGAGTIDLGSSSSAVLTANESSDATLSGTIEGAGSLAKTGAGTLTLSGTNSYSGGTTIAEGTVIGSATSFGSGGIVNDGALVIDQPSAAIFANAIDGTGSLTKTGAGSLKLTGNSNLSGATTVASGLLSVNGYLGNSAVTVQNGATLGGNGTVGATRIESGGTVSPGNSIGTLSVNGDFSQAAGSTYHVEVDPASGSSSDRIVVNGAATIESGSTLEVQKIAPGAYPVNAEYTVLSATDGVTGTYALTGDVNGAFYALTDAYDANNVYLKAVKVRNFVDAAKTRNEIATAGALQTLPDGNPMKDAVSMQSNDDDARHAFNQLSGELHASVKTALINDSRYIRDTAISRVRQSFCAPGAGNSIATAGGASAGCSGSESQPAVWARAFGAWGDTDGDGNAARLRQTTGGFMMGTDTLVGGRWRVGALAGYSNTSLNVDERNSSASSDNYHVGVYGGTQWGNLGFRTGAAFSWHSISTARSPSFVGYSDNVNSDYNARTTQVFGDIGYRFTLPMATIEPFANIAYVNLRNSSFSEQGGAAALAGQSGTTNTAFSTLGVRGSTDLALGSKTKVTLNGSLAWQYAFGNTVPESTLAFAGSDQFTVGGVPIARNAALVQGGVDFHVTSSATLGLNYGGQFGGGTTSQTVQGTFKATF
ncbi:autotransporter domain-containing protein [Paraburkholderia antibiotica]|uniref:Autotransporter domain-containing protein n=1 Tax=Paraburkholderia antibiotica TaxID=2728839 RepID=A0A7Y0A0J7_9BURK|nr:autotransporter domain-containing protein [Paraburkholderia antibiotica]NML34290.1 autotransporter domain-containing protein [Paraburkholderia antibiotica]